jgi:YD repeat-containing protein
MVALVAGNSLGLNLTSLATLGARGVAGNAALGRGTDRVTVNVANGNLVIQNQDDALAGPGLWSASQRTYNSQEHLAGDHRLPGLQPPRLSSTGAIGQRNSSIVRKDADGGEDTYAYDANRALYLSTDGGGAYDTLRYRNNQLVWTDGDTGTTEYYARYQNQWQLVRRQDTDGNALAFLYNKDGQIQPARATQPQTTHTIYDAGKRNHARFIVSPEGRVTEYRYNATGQRIVELRYAAAYRDSSMWAVSYPQQLPTTPLGLGAPLSAGGYTGAAPTEALLAAWAAAQDPGQVVRTDYRYDFRGQLQQQLRYPVVPGDGSLEVATAGGANPNLYASTIGNGNSVGNGTGNGNANGKGNGVGNGGSAGTVGNVNGNGSGKPTAPADITQYVYDAFGRLLQTISPNGGVTSYAYDGLNRLLATTDAEGNFTATSYDDAGRRTTVQSANGLHTVSAYDAVGRLVSLMQTDAAGQPLAIISHDYDADGRLRHSTDPTGVERWMLYDDASRLVAEIDGKRSLTEQA